MRSMATKVVLLVAVGMLGATAMKGQGDQKQAPFDVVILHGHIIDGTGSPWYSGDVGIRDGHIAAIGDLAAAPAKQKIDAHGKVVAPGFVDMLGQSELTILVDPRLPSKMRRMTRSADARLRSGSPLDWSTITRRPSHRC